MRTVWPRSWTLPGLPDTDDAAAHLIEQAGAARIECALALLRART